MEKLIFIISICSFLMGLIFMVADVDNDEAVFKFLAKIIGTLGVVCPIIYWLKLLQII